MGEHETTFPIFAAALESEDMYEIRCAILGFAAIDTEEATQLILNLPPRKNEYTPKRARANINFMEIIKGDKL